MFGDIGSTPSDNDRLCNLFIGLDESLYNQHDHNMSALTSLVQKHVDYANNVFASQIRVPPTDGSVYFFIDHIQVMFGSCDGLELVEEQNCTHIRGKFLDFFDSNDFQKYCIAMLFTYRDFKNGTGGLAYVGTACRRRRNSGFVTLLNFGQDVQLAESMVTFVHEVAHTFGADHNSDVNKDDDSGQRFDECNDLDTYIMSDVHRSSAFTDADVQYTFSKCAVDSIVDYITNISPNRHCLARFDSQPADLVARVNEGQPTTALCGNNLVEVGEECDCGLEYTDCDDPCCYAAQIDPADRYANVTAFACARKPAAEFIFCRHASTYLFGIVGPFVSLLAYTVAWTAILIWDWRHGKYLFGHIIRPEYQLRVL